MTIFYTALMGALGGACIANSYYLVRQARLLNDLRFAAYYLTTMAGAQIADLQASLRAAGVTLSNDHVAEQLRRLRLTPEESLAEFNAVVAQWEAQTYRDSE